MEKILLHVCCGPCACYPVESLREKKLEPIAFWFNPNIHPFSEYIKRVESFLKMANKVKMEFFSSEDSQYIEDWLEYTRNAWIKKSKEERCLLCYEFRLKKTVEFAKNKGFSKFTTTLLYSRYQYHDDIKKICSNLAEKYGVSFFYEDFRKGWNKGIKLSKDYELYRQKYCGCLFSEIETLKAKI